jgi:IS30 family transposase
MFEPFPLAYPGDDGVIDMELLSVIRRWHYRDHFSIREISRRTGLSRNTVRKYLRSDGYDGSYNRVAAFARDWKVARQQEHPRTSSGRCRCLSVQR